MELRLIEYMDVGNRNQWALEQVLPAAQMVERIHARWPLAAAGSTAGWQRPGVGAYGDGRGGSIGVIASIRSRSAAIAIACVSRPMGRPSPACFR